jgi:O-phosphoseryl-tRNA synthetase
MPFDVERIKREAKGNYEKAWLETRNLLKISGNLFKLEKKGKTHAIFDFISDARKKMVTLGFEELVLPMFVEEDEIYKQYGPEAALILDRLFYLAGLPRPDIGISKEKVDKIQSIVPNFDKIEELKNVFRDYKKGEIEADNFVEIFVEKFNVKENEATEIIDKIFPELKSLKPIPTKTTLRSHTTALWFKILAELWKKKKLPLQYFTICPKFRREQKIDATHLYDSNTLSLVVMTEEISLEDCKNIAYSICEQIGFKDSKAEIKKATSKYYAPQTEFEIFVQHPKTKEYIEIGDGGFYSPISLANYGIPYPVFNVGFGVERICMIKTEIDDIRKLVYPYFYENISFSDEEISKGVKYKYVPLTKKGIEIKDAIIETCIKHKNDPSPVVIKVWSGEIKDKKVEVTAWENDKGVKLLGPASLNKIWVKDSSILGLAPEKPLNDGVDTGITYLEGIALEMAYNIEVMIDQNKREYEHRVKMVARAAEVNVQVDDIVLEYIHSKQKKVDVRGPVFVGLTFKVL